MTQFLYSKRDLVEAIRDAAIDAMAEASKDIATSTVVAFSSVRLNKYINDEQIPNNIYFHACNDYISVSFSMSTKRYSVVYKDEDGIELAGNDEFPSLAISKMLDVVKKYYFDIED